MSLLTRPHLNIIIIKAIGIFLYVEINDDTFVCEKKNITLRNILSIIFPNLMRGQELKIS